MLGTVLRDVVQEVLVLPEVQCSEFRFSDDLTLNVYGDDLIEGDAATVQQDCPALRWPCIVQSRLLEQPFA